MVIVLWENNYGILKVDCKRICFRDCCRKAYGKYGSVKEKVVRANKSTSEARLTI